MRQPAFRAYADLLIEPAVEAFPILAFDRYAAIIDIGYATARARIAEWQAALVMAAQTAPAVAGDR
jgi:predicted acylesterase/phospholipase RssA